MVSQSQRDQLKNVRRRLEERAEIVRVIAAHISSMDESSIQTREMIAESRQVLRRADRLLKRK